MVNSKVSGIYNPHFYLCAVQTFKLFEIRFKNEGYIADPDCPVRELSFAPGGRQLYLKRKFCIGPALVNNVFGVMNEIQFCDIVGQCNV